VGGVPPMPASWPMEHDRSPRRRGFSVRGPAPGARAQVSDLGGLQEEEERNHAVAPKSPKKGERGGRELPGRNLGKDWD